MVKRNLTSCVDTVLRRNFTTTNCHSQCTFHVCGPTY